MAAGSTQLSATSEQLAVSFGDQSSQIVATASATEEISVSSEEVLRSLDEMKDKTETADKNITAGRAKLLSAVKEITDIKAMWIIWVLRLTTFHSHPAVSVIYLMLLMI
ncbi:MAG: hypothetical protein LRY50_15565 [Geovibrio sp.]|nr:hypothetical protein [Geovibrio sp.]